MNSFVADQLDEAISSLLLGSQSAPGHWDPQLDPLLTVAAELKCLPRPEFRGRLRAQLLRTAATHAAQHHGVSSVSGRTSVSQQARRVSLMPPLFSTGTGTLPVRGVHLALSFALHVAALSLVAASGWWMVENRAAVRRTVAELVPTDAYLLPPAPGEAHGGGGGGDSDKMKASQGSAPRFASEQLTPPAVIVRNEDPKLPAEPTVIGPPDLVLPQSAQPGDPMATLAPPSNGTGFVGATGSGDGGGVGGGEGPGVGEGRGGGIGGGVFHVGGGVLAPRAIYAPDPEFSDEARKAKYQGSVVLSVIIGPDGRPRNLRIMRSLGMGLDEKATEAVTQWRFEPARKDGKPVAVEVNIEVAFRLY